MPDEGQDRQAEVGRAYGVLATSLNEALVDVRDALHEHAALLPAGMVEELDELLAEFARKRVRVAVYGEVKAGKSTLINALAGAALSPVAFDPLTSLPVRVTYGSRTVWHVGDRTLDDVDDLARVMRDDRELREVVVETPLDLLQLGGQVDLLDTPGVGSEERFDVISGETLRSLDAVILVVRYPALFTQFTRRIMHGLENDIGKLFVVWNLDADCAELSAAERAQHASTLRSNVAGAHELYLVDARAGFRAVQAKDAKGLAASGLPEFTASLARFASSQGRELAALREAAKRAHGSLDEARQRLSRRHEELNERIETTRDRLRAVQHAAEAEMAKLRARHADFQATVGRLGEERASAGKKLAARLRKELRSARRRWMRTGDYLALEDSVEAANRKYADDAATLSRDTHSSLGAAARSFETVLATAARAPTPLPIDQLAPAERMERAVGGNLPWLRRSVWWRWYAPGLETALRAGIVNDLVAQSTWFEELARQAEEAAVQTRDAKLADIHRRAEAESETIKQETDFDASVAEFEALGRHLPIVGERLSDIREVNTEARGLMN